MKRPKRFQRKSTGEIILHIIVALIFCIVGFSYLYSLIWAFLAGVRTHTDIVMNPFGWPTEWHWENYLDVFTELNVNGHGFFEMLLNSIYFSVLRVFLNLFITINFAYCCTKYKFPGSTLPYTIILIMITLPIYGSAGAQYKIVHSLGLTNSYLYVLTSLSGFGVSFLYFRAFFQNMSWSYAEAAMMDGANDFQIYFKVMFPMAKPIFGALFLTQWLPIWNSYEQALVYYPNLPTLPVGIYQFSKEMLYRARLDILFASCVLISIPALILFIAFNKVITTNISLGGLKG